MIWHSPYKTMIILVMFDLPTATKKERQKYGKFRRLLLKEGFVMMQFSIYYRFSFNDDSFEKIQKRLQKIVPTNSLGSIKILSITEKQFEKMVIIYPEDEKKQEIEKKYSGKSQLLLF